MPDDNQNKNFDSFLDDKITNSLEDHTSQDFIIEMMKRVQLAEEFEKEDVKTSKIAKYVIGGFVSFLSVFIVLFTFVVNTNKDSNDVGYFNNMVDKFSDTIETISIFTTENLGFSFDFQTGLIILVVMACVFLFTVADRVIFKKGI
jgi:hypothetical protein